MTDRLELGYRFVSGLRITPSTRERIFGGEEEPGIEFLVPVRYRGPCGRSTAPLSSSSPSISTDTSL